MKHLTTWIVIMCISWRLANGAVNTQLRINKLNKSYIMDIILEIQKEEMEVGNLVKDWHVQKLSSFIEDLLIKDREEQFRIYAVSCQREQLIDFKNWWYGNRHNAREITNEEIDNYLGN